MFYPEAILESILIKIRLVYIYKQGWKSIHKKYKACQCNVNTQKENQDHQNSSNEMENVMLKGHPMPQLN